MEEGLSSEEGDNREAEKGDGGWGMGDGSTVGDNRRWGKGVLMRD
jgi:hypothetical protein